MVGYFTNVEMQLKELGVDVICSCQNTIISVKIKGISSRTLAKGHDLIHQLIQEKVQYVLKSHLDPNTRRYIDPSFGPSTLDPDGINAICKENKSKSSSSASKLLLTVRNLLEKDKLRWERPEYTDDSTYINSGSVDTDILEDGMGFTDRPFASEAKLFCDGVSAGDVIQGQLGDCWILSAMSVVATRSDLLQLIFWEGERYSKSGLYVCRIMKNFVWQYVIIDDRLLVTGYSRGRSGTLYFARCRDPNELWVPLLEKAYAKFHGCYEAIIGGYVDAGLNDLTGMCSEQIVMKRGYPGFVESLFKSTTQAVGESFWEKLVEYQKNGSLMGCSIQPPPSSSSGTVVAEANAGHGLYYKHAYALIHTLSIKTKEGKTEKLLQLRNPWGKGEWNGDWSDDTTERQQNQDIIDEFLQHIKRGVHKHMNKTTYLAASVDGKMTTGDISSHEVTDVDTNDGTFFMSYTAWIENFTHFFAGIAMVSWSVDFPEEWSGQRVEGCWNDKNCGGNPKALSWLNNPQYQLSISTTSHIFISLSQEDFRGNEKLKLLPISFHILRFSATAKGTWELREKTPQKVIPGSVTEMDPNGVPQAEYALKQSVSVEIKLIQPGKYIIIPSVYMRIDPTTKETCVGRFWISVYSNTTGYMLAGAEEILEEEEIYGSDQKTVRMDQIHKAQLQAPAQENISNKSAILQARSLPKSAKKKQIHVKKDEILDQANVNRIEFGELTTQLPLQRLMETYDFYGRKVSLEKSNSGDDNNVESERLLYGAPNFEDHDVPVSHHPQGHLDIVINGVKGLMEHFKQSSLYKTTTRRIIDFEALKFSSLELRTRNQIIQDIFAKNPALYFQLRKLTGAIHCERPKSTSNSQLAENSAVNNPFHELYIDLLKRTSEQTRIEPDDAKVLPSSLQSGEKQDDSTINPISQVPVADHITKQYSSTNVIVLHTTKRMQSLEKCRTDQLNSILRRKQQALGNKDKLDALPRLIEGRKRGSTMNPILNVPVADRITKQYSSTNITVLHTTTRMQSLEKCRTDHLSSMLRIKQQALGNKDKLDALPRLIGGRKSGSTYTSCVDCGLRAHLASKKDNAYVCEGSNCNNCFCPTCYYKLPKRRKVCDDCFEQEELVIEPLGAHLRIVLVEKLGVISCKTHTYSSSSISSNDEDSSTSPEAALKKAFEVFNQDSSTKVDFENFKRVMMKLDIKPQLSIKQVESLFRQVSIDCNGTICYKEFCDWMYKDHAWSPNIDPKNNTAEKKSGNETPILIHQNYFASIIEDIIIGVESMAHGSGSNSYWITSTSTTNKIVQIIPESLNQLYYRSETGAIFYQRIATLQHDDLTLFDYFEGDDGIAKLFEDNDTENSGVIYMDQFMRFLRAIGLQVTYEIAQLLMYRVNVVHYADPPNCVSKNELMIYLRKIKTLKYDQSLKTSLEQIKGNVLPASDMIGFLSILLSVEDESSRALICNILQALEPTLEVVKISRMARRIREVSDELMQIASQPLLLRLAIAFNVKALYDFKSRHCDAIKAIPGKSRGSYEYLDFTSGDVLETLLFTNKVQQFVDNIRSFSVVQICNELKLFVEHHAMRSTPTEIWQTLFGLQEKDEMKQSEFLRTLIFSGFRLSNFEDNKNCDSKQSYEEYLNAVSTYVLVALVLDAVRYDIDIEESYDEGDYKINFLQFSTLLNYSSICENEKILSYTSTNYQQLCDKSNNYLISVALDGKDLIMRITEPIFKFEMNMILNENEYSGIEHFQNFLSSYGVNTNEKSADQTFKKSVAHMHRDHAFAKEPTQLATTACHPHLDKIITEQLDRLRVCKNKFIHSPTGFALYLKIVESDGFISQLSDLLARIDPPCFWSVSPTMLEYFIDMEILQQQQVDQNTSLVHIFQENVLNHLLHHEAARPLKTLVKHSTSTLSIRFAIIGSKMESLLTWTTFQNILQSHNKIYFTLDLCPQGESFLSSEIQTDGSGVQNTNISHRFAVYEPESSDYHLDFPIIFTDTVCVSSPPIDSTSSSRRITFISEGSTSIKSCTPGRVALGSINSFPRNIEKHPNFPANTHGYFMIINVRLAQPKQAGDQKRLYATAYDPFTSSEYAIEGYDKNWDVNFFSHNQSESHDFEDVYCRWQSVLSRMWLGKSLTPKLICKVFMHKKHGDMLLGECEVPISSAFSHEGQMYDDWYELYNPTKVSHCNLHLHLSFTFMSSSSNLKLKNSMEDKKARSITTPEEKILRSSNANFEHAQKIKILEEELENVKCEKSNFVAEVQSLKDKLREERDARPITSQAAIDSVSEEITDLKRKLMEKSKDLQIMSSDYQEKIASLEIKLQEKNNLEFGAEISQTSATEEIYTLSQAGLGENSQALEMLSAMKRVLLCRSPDRPFLGLKKAVLSVQESAAHVESSALFEVLCDFGLSLTQSQANVLWEYFSASEDPKLINIEDFFRSLCQDAKLYSSIENAQLRIKSTSGSRLLQGISIILPHEANKKSNIDSNELSPISRNSTSSHEQLRMQTSDLAAPSDSWDWKEMASYLENTLPDGWDLRVVRDSGKPYFGCSIDHSTHWHHPVPEVHAILKQWMKKNPLAIYQNISKPDITPQVNPRTKFASKSTNYQVKKAQPNPIRRDKLG